jgi:hypothetical protein
VLVVAAAVHEAFSHKNGWCVISMTAQIRTPRAHVTRSCPFLDETIIHRNSVHFLNANERLECVKKQVGGCAKVLYVYRRAARRRVSGRSGRFVLMKM